MNSTDMAAFQAARARVLAEQGFMVRIIELNGLTPLSVEGEKCVWSRPLNDEEKRWAGTADTLLAAMSPADCDPETFLKSPDGRVEEAFYGDWLDAGVVL
jgi:hypothetical protein